MGAGSQQTQSFRDRRSEKSQKGKGNLCEHSTEKTVPPEVVPGVASFPYSRDRSP